MTPFETYKEYLALKNHFSKESYDYFKYNGKLRVKQDSFNSRKDRLWFEKLAKHPDVHGYLVANLSANPKLWIRDLAYSEEAERVYKEWLKRNQSLTYNIKRDVDKIAGDFKRAFGVVGGSHPKLLVSYNAGSVSLETLCALLKSVGAKKVWDEKMTYDPFWQELRVKVEKYTPFINFDEKKVREIIVDKFDLEDYNK